MTKGGGDCPLASVLAPTIQAIARSTGMWPQGALLGDSYLYSGGGFVGIHLAQMHKEELKELSPPVQFPLAALS